MGKRQTVIELMHKSGILTRLPQLPQLTVLTYHRIRGDSSGRDCNFDASVLGPTQAEFAAQLSWLKKNADPIDEAVLLAALAGREKLPRRAVLVTFDDGYRDNFDLALPVLTAHAMSAIFFIAPDLIDRRRVGFWDRAAWIVKHANRNGHFDIFGNIIDLSSGYAKIYAEVIAHLKGSRACDPDGALAELAAAVGAKPTDPQLEDLELMTWEHLHLLKEAGMAIGSHGLTHRILARLPKDEQRQELQQSKAILEANLACPVQTIAFPAGSPGAYSTLTQDLAKEAGYAACFSFETGVNNASRLESRDIRRIPIGNSVALAACSVKAPWLIGNAFYG